MPRGGGAFAGPVPPWSFFTFTQNIGMALAGGFAGAGLAVTWSLAVEEQFYLTLPVIVRNLGRQRLFYFMVATVIAAPFLRALLFLYLPNAGISSYVLMPCRADALCLGVLSAMIVRTDQGQKAVANYRWAIYLIFCLGGTLVLFMSPGYEKLKSRFYGLEYSLLAVFYVSLLLIALGDDRSL